MEGDVVELPDVDGDTEDLLELPGLDGDGDLCELPGLDGDSDTWELPGLDGEPSGQEQVDLEQVEDDDDDWLEIPTLQVPKRRRFQYVPGRSRESMLLEKPQVDMNQWRCVQVPRWLDGTIQDDFAEVFSPPRIMKEILKLHLRGELSADTDTGWRLDLEKDRIRLVQAVRARRPKVLHVCSPCKFHSKLMQTNWFRMPQIVREQLFREHQLLLDFAMMLCNLQFSEGRKYSHEHPKEAISWKSRSVRMVSVSCGSLVAEFDFCAFGMTTKTDGRPVKKPTKLLTNCKAIHDRFHRRKCGGGHRHCALQGSEGGVRRTQFAQIYPKQFCATYAEAVLAHTRTE